MIIVVCEETPFNIALDKIGLGEAIRRHGSALIKVNLARPPEAGHPRTDPRLLTRLIHYIAACGGQCTLAEGANGFLRQNIKTIGLEATIRDYQVKIQDTDLDDFDCVTVDGEKHYLPKCLKDYAVRIGLPATSKRPNMIFSNNVKLFVGAVPRSMYQVGEPTTWRPRVHENLHRSVATIYRAIMAYAPFGFFVNGGNMMVEGRGESEWDKVFVGTNAIELDLYVLEALGLEKPKYLEKLIATFF